MIQLFNDSKFIINYMAHTKIKTVILLLLLAATGVHAQPTCYQIGLNEGMEIYNDAQRLSRSGRCVDAVPRYWEALSRFRLTRTCRDLPTNHELETWENRCIQGVAACGGKLDESTVLNVSPRTLTFPDTGGAQPITVNTNAGSWRVDKSPAWCTTRRSGNRLTVTCEENAGADRSDKIVIIANTLSYEVTIEQAGKAIAETPPFESIKVNDVQFAGKFADGASKGFGETLTNNMTFLLPRITCDHLAPESKNIKLDFKIYNPEGRLLQGAETGYTFSEEITARGNMQQNDVFEVSEWGARSGTTFAATGTYTFEIWCAGVKMFAADFDVLPKPVIAREQIQITDARFRGKYAADTPSDFNRTLYNNMTFLLPRITCNFLTAEVHTIKLDYRILDPDGNSLRLFPDATWSSEITTRGVIVQDHIFEAPEMGSAAGNAFAKTGVYQFEILSSGVSLYAASFELIEPSAQETIRAASPSQLKASAGIKAGLNLTNINNGMVDYEFIPVMRPDFHAGVFFNLNFGYQPNKPGFLGIQPELLFSRQGFSVKGSNVSFSYVTVPLMIKLYAYQGLNLELGPFISFMMAAKPDTQEIDGAKFKLSGLKGSKDAGVAVGMGYDMNVGLVVGARYQHGLSDMANNLLWTNRLIQIYLGWKF